MPSVTPTPIAGELEAGLKALRFPAQWEARFVAETGPQRVRHFIISALVGLLIYNMFVVADWFILPDMRLVGTGIRLGIVTPVELAALYLLYRREAWFVRQPPWQAEGVIVITSLIAACSLALVINMSHGPIRMLGHAGFAPLLVYGNVVQRLRFKSSLLVSFLILLMHGGMLLSIADELRMAVLPLLLLNLLTAFFSLVSNYEMEYEERRRFVLNESEKRLLDQLKNSNDELDLLTRRDALTGCANRRHAKDYLLQHLAASDASMAMVLLDVDHFKAYNDHYGHPAGDRCLQSVAAAIDRVIHPDQGLVVRWGGEEFMVILPDHELHQAQQVAEAIRQAVVALDIPHSASQSAAMVTVSLGVAQGRQSGDAEVFLDDLQEQADGALYQAKAAGRNAVRPAVR